MNRGVVGVATLDGILTVPCDDEAPARECSDARTASNALNGRESGNLAADFRSVRGENLHPNVAGAAVVEVPRHHEPAIGEWNHMRPRDGATAIGIDRQLAADRQSRGVDDPGMDLVDLR